MSLWPFGKKKKTNKTEATELNQIETTGSQQTESVDSSTETLMAEPIKDSIKEVDVNNEAETQNTTIEEDQTQIKEDHNIYRNLQ